MAASQLDNSADAMMMNSASASGAQQMQTKSYMAMTTSGSNQQASSTTSSKSNGQAMFSNANSAWDSLQAINKGCCDKCKTICGFAIYVYGSNYALTNKGNYFTF